MPHRYAATMVASLPVWQNKFDWILATTLTGGAIVLTGGFWPIDAVQWVALSGGVVGVLIACVRLWRMLTGGKE